MGISSRSTADVASFDTCDGLSTVIGVLHDVVGFVVEEKVGVFVAVLAIVVWIIGDDTVVVDVLVITALGNVN